MASTPNQPGNLNFKLGVIGVIALIAILIPFFNDPVNPKTGKKLKNYPSFFNDPVGAVKARVKDVPGLTRGLDLQGGDHIVLSMDPSPAVLGEVNNAIGLVKPDVMAQAPGASLANDPANPKVFIVTGVPKEKLADVQHKIESRLTNFSADPTETGFKVTMTDAAYETLKEKAVELSRAVIETRINSTGVSEPVVQRQGKDRIVVEVAGNENSNQLRELIGTSGRLEWHVMVGDKTYESPDKAKEANGGILPAGTALYESHADTDSPTSTWYLLQSNAPLTGQDLRTATATQDNTGKVAVGFTFNVRAGETFRELTRANLKKRLAIVLNEKVITAPTIESEIGAEGIIHGNFTAEEVETIVGQLKGGSMPATPHIEASTAIGPSLGAASIKSGFLSLLLGLALVALFMLAYYRRAGLNAIVALVLNLFITMAVMSLMHAVLTLPGIAGVILTIGMAVDANVLVFERIREELRAGKTVLSAIEAGFSKAWSAIFDSNFSTMLAALCLIFIGQGPVKGFAVTLTVGLIASLFTAVGVSRVIFEWEYARPGAKNTDISIGNVNAFSNLNFQLMKYKLHWLMISLLLLVVGLVTIKSKGIPLGLDLSGGTEIEVKFADGKDTDPTALEAALKSSIAGESKVTPFGKTDDHTVLVRASKTATVQRSAVALMSDEEFTKADKTRLMGEAVTHAFGGGVEAGKLDLNTASYEQIRDQLKPALAAGTLKADPKLTSDQAAENLAREWKNARDAAGIVPADGKLPGVDAAAADYLYKNNGHSKFVIRRLEFVGPAVGDELRSTAFWAVLISTLAHLIYLWFRFELRFSIGAIVAMIHDVLITLGIFCLAAPALGLEMSLPVLAAFLTLTGYSINDTIVVFDRIRETLKKKNEADADEDGLFNRALNETLSRTLLTSLVTFLAVLAMFLLGGPALRGFSFVMLVGVVVGTYSSIYIASPWAIAWRKLQDKWFPQKADAIASRASARR